MLGFVDNKRHYVIFLTKQTPQQILTAIEISVGSWNELLHFVGGDS